MVDNDSNRNSKRFSDLPHRKLRSDFDGKIAGLYDLEETIGEGHFAVVKLARHVFTGEKVAVKVIDKLKLDDVSKAHLFQEVRCMKLVQHPNVVRLYEVIDTQTKLYLILELGDGGDMYDYIMKHTNGLEEGKARLFFRQIVEAISYCHKLHVVHRDLKPENVVFFKKLEVVKLTDFGFSNMFNPGNKLETSCGSLAYSAPEILLGDSYDAQAVDIWSLGVILYMLVCGEPPFREANDSETLTMIMDCKYKIPAHVSVLCQSLISVMLKREPGHRANLSEIENHEWLKVDSNAVPHYHLPLISREQVSKEDHEHVVEKMVEGCIATKEEILQSLEKDMYNHITATYYLLAERRLRRHRQELLNQASMMHIRKNSAPSFNHGKPHLEPLALSPRKPKEVKKTRTEPLKSAMAQMLSIAESPETEFPVGATVDNNQDDYFKSLTQSMTLGRRPKAKAEHLSLETSHTPSAVNPRLGSLTKSPVPLLKEPCSGKKPKHRGFSKIAILSSFFESKIAALASSASPKPGFWRMSISKKKSRVKQRGLPSIPILVDTPANCSCEQLNCDHCVKSKEAESTDEKKTVTKQQVGLVSSLLSPPGTHPTPSSSLMASPTDERSSRKFSLIQEESLDEATEGEEEDMELEELIDTTVRMTKSAEQLDLDDNSSRNARSPSRESEQLFTKRPLLSVASSPQLLNQIYEENESDEEDDIVPAKLNPTSRLGAQRNSLASPELIRKYEARKKHRGAGSRGTSCSSSDASDTDDTDGRSRKNKLKHKFIHRRDSSDHSSDTDGGPSGHGGGGLGKGFGGGNSGGGDGSGGGGPSNDGQDKTDGGGKKNGKSGSQRSGGHHSHGKQNNLHQQDNQLSLHAWSTRTSEIGGNLCLTSLSLTNKSSLKYVLERDENVSDSDAEDNGDEPIVKETNKMSHVDKMKSSSLSKQNGCTYFMNIGEKHSVANEIILCPQTFNLNGNKHDKKVTVQMDINSNMFFKPESCRDSPMKIETKCCSLV